MTPELMTGLFMLATSITTVIGLEIARHFMARKEVVFDQGILQVKEFRAQIAELQARQDLLEGELTKWKDRYYVLVQEMAAVKGERDSMAIDIKRLQAEVAVLRAEVDRRTGGK